MLDISVDCRLAQAGVPISNRRLDDRVGFLNSLFRRLLGKQFMDGARHGDYYAARFRGEDAARVAMGWCDLDLSHLRINRLENWTTLSGHLSGEQP